MITLSARNRAAQPAEDPSPSLGDYLLTLPQYILPQHLASRLVYFATRLKLRPWKNWLIRWFIRRYGVDMNIAEHGSPLAYPDFNSFFTRALRNGTRSICNDEDAITSPIDGTFSQVGYVKDGQLFQAKGHTYSLGALLGGDTSLARLFSDGAFATLYLPPKNYHRIHMPIDGQLTKMVYVPGRLFAVNPRTMAIVNGLFARNERVISIFDTQAGPTAVILVGALFVGSVETTWAGRITPRWRRRITIWNSDELPGGPIALKRGAEMGRFNMGSTVILLHTPGCVEWLRHCQPGTVVQCGQRLGSIICDR